MRFVHAAVVALALCGGCFKKPAPPVPPDLIAALDEFGRAADGERGAPALSAASDRLIDQMGMYQGSGAPVRTQADLQQLKREIAVIAAQFTNGDEEARAKWRELRPKIDRVLQGENPEPGPRYQLDMPEDVRAAIQEADDAFAGGDRERISSAVGRARGAICEWAQKMPGQRGIRMAQDCEEQVIYDASPEQMRASWETTKARMQPGAQF